MTAHELEYGSEWDLRAGYGCCPEDWCQAVPRVLCSNRRRSSGGVPVCDSCRAPHQEQGWQEEVELRCFVNGLLHRFSLHSVMADGARAK